MDEFFCSQVGPFWTRITSRVAAETAQTVAQHYGDIAASAPFPGDDPTYDDAAVTMGCDAAAAAECAAWLLPSAAELSVRVAANSVAYDDEAYYAGAHGDDPNVDSGHPHLVARRAERAVQWKLFVDIFGDVSQAAEVTSDWLILKDGAIPKLAQAIYDDRTFDRLPELAYELQAAGFKNEEILKHLREPCPHVRGCWALDLILGKE